MNRRDFVKLSGMGLASVFLGGCGVSLLDDSKETVAAVENGHCDAGTDVRVALPGGDLTVRYQNGRVFLTGGAVEVFSGSFEY